MFYQTQYRKNCGLRFVGNLPVNEGDLVWTDGNVIFGHVPKKNSSSFPLQQPVIPVKGYKDSFNGFISKGGQYTPNKNLIDDDWIVNNEISVEHGDDMINGQRIIDALLSKDNDLFVAAEGFYQKNNPVQFYHPLYSRTLESPNQWVIDNLIDISRHYYPYTVLNRIRYGRGTPVTLGTTKMGADKDNDLIIYKNGEEFVRHNLKSYADLTINEAFSVRDKIMAHSIKEGLSLLNADDPPESFIASVFARVLTLNIKQNGDWDALITTSAYGFCFPFFSFDASMFYASFPDNEDKTFSELLDLCMTKLEINLYDDHFIPIDVTRYPDFVGEKKDDKDNYTDEYQQYILDKCEYYIPRVKFRHNVWFPAFFHAAFLFKIHNGVLVDTINEYSGGGLYVVAPDLMEWNERQIIPHDIFIKVETKNNRKNIVFPIGDDYYFVASNGAISAIYNNQNAKLLDLNHSSFPNARDWKSCFFENYVALPPTLTPCELDNRAYYWSSQWHGTINSVASSVFNIYIRKYWKDDWWTYAFYSGDSAPSLTDGLSSIIILNFDDEEVFFGHSGWLNFYHPNNIRTDSVKYYDFSTVKITGIPDSVYDWTRIKVCFCELSNGKVLFGLRGYPLFAVRRDGKVTKISDNLRNFRLNLLKNKTKALLGVL